VTSLKYSDRPSHTRGDQLCAGDDAGSSRCKKHAVSIGKDKQYRSVDYRTVHSKITVELVVYLEDPLIGKVKKSSTEGDIPKYPSASDQQVHLILMAFGLEILCRFFLT
jgi:hypothetical protein